MPLYEFECEACKKRFERIQKFTDPRSDVCPHCGKGPVRKLFSSPAIQFKGSGFYITDYAKKSVVRSQLGKSEQRAVERRQRVDVVRARSRESKSESKSAETKSTDTEATTDSKS